MILTRKNFLVTVFLFMAFCLNAENNGKVIPFTLKDYIPCFTVKDSKGVEYSFLFDSGYNYAALFPSALKKLSLTEKDLVNNAFVNIKQEFENETDSQIYKRAKKLINDNKMQFTFTDEFFQHEQIFNYEKKNILHNKSDGIVGIDFFNAQRSLTIDYENKCIIIDGDILEGNTIPMQKESFGLYSVTTEINDVKQKAIIDTGSKYLVLKKNYRQNDETEFEKEKFIYDENVKIILGLDFGNIVNVKYGNNVFHGRGLNYNNCFLKISDSGRRICYKYCIFGYPFMKEKAIQFNFENNEFCIR